MFFRRLIGGNVSFVAVNSQVFYEQLCDKSQPKDMYPTSKDSNQYRHSGRFFIGNDAVCLKKAFGDGAQQRL